MTTTHNTTSSSGTTSSSRTPLADQDRFGVAYAEQLGEFLGEAESAGHLTVGEVDIIWHRVLDAFHTDPPTSGLSRWEAFLTGYETTSR